LRVAELIGLWPPSTGVEETEYETAGGPLRAWVASRACAVKVLAPDVETKSIEADIVISPLASEVLLSDRAISELEIAIEDPWRGYWRFTWEPKEKLRRSEPPRYWR
ncbi:MAG: hypothetical protein N3H31_07230, partial [Candidatus Nezhaarchaeota archaeon]|nr:hypothetical protein [Candidatus Nezhaarchaeota archaeon]